MKKNSAQNIFELDLLHFHGKPQILDLHAPAGDVDWIFDDADSDFQLVPDSEFVADFKASLIGTTVRIVGRLVSQFEYRCGKCLSHNTINLDSEVEFVLMSEADWSAKYGSNEEIALSADDMDVSYYEDDIIDLRPLIREAVLLNLPAFPLCPESQSEDCELRYKHNLGEETLQKLENNKIDLRWSALKNIQLSSDKKN